MNIVTVLGASGVFGGRAAEALAGHPDTVVRIVGRDAVAGAATAARVAGEFRRADLNDRDSLRAVIAGSHVVIHAAGPFQGGDFRVAEACIDAGSHYIDIADDRAFVTGISAIDDAARSRGMFVTSGASSVPAISDAMITAMAREFREIDSIEMALSPGNRNPRGASTIASILSYVGRPMRIWQDGAWIERPGWGDAKRVEFPAPLGRRRVHNCDAPDLELFPSRWHARTVRFRAGVELDVLNVTLSGIAWLRRFISLPNLPRRAALFRRLSLLLLPFGTSNGGFVVCLRGTSHDAVTLERRIAVVSTADGPAIPTAPAVLLAKRLLTGSPPRLGAFPCVGFVALTELIEYLKPLGACFLHGTRDGWEPIEM